MTTQFKNYIIIALTAIIFVLIAIYYIWLKPSETTLARSPQESILISKDSSRVIELQVKADSLQTLLDSSKNNVKVIKQVVYKEKAGVIGEVATDEKMERFKKFLGDFYDTQTHEVGIEPVPLGKLTLTLNEKEYKGGELLKTSYEGEKKINTELTKELTFSDQIRENLNKQLATQKDIIRLKDIQLDKLERIKVPVIKERKWYIDAGIIAGSLTIGAAIGIIYSNNR